MLKAATALVVSCLCLVACHADEPRSALAARDIVLEVGITEIAGTVPSHTTLDAMLRVQGVANDVAQRLIEAVRPVFDPRKLRAARPFLLARTASGALRRFDYEIDNDRVLRVSPSGPEEPVWRAEVVPIPKTLEAATVAGRIDESTPSLYQAMDAAGEGPELTVALANIFSGEIDFNTEIQPNDRFGLVFERYRREGRPSSYGAIRAAEFVNDGRLIRAIRFTPRDGRTDYFDEQGRSLRRFFLKSPLPFEPRITSRFSSGRMHPVLHFVRAHRGVDYGAPTGAPVVAVAPATVLSATTDGVNGRMVRLRHASGYESDYLHLSAFAPGIQTGAHVDQGQLIGRVGSTGLATGPHLHYALKKNGTFVNPLNEQRNMPPGEPVPAAEMDAFSAARDSLLAQLAARHDGPAVVPAVATR